MSPTDDEDKREARWRSRVLFYLTLALLVFKASLAITRNDNEVWLVRLIELARESSQ